jgi:hypothetical protein
MLEKPLHSVNLVYENSSECEILLYSGNVIECMVGIINVQTYHLFIPSIDQVLSTFYMIHIRTKQIQV